MDFADRLREIAAHIPQQLTHIRTEEATKIALVMPFIQALGYDVFDPAEVTPELVADVGIKKGEKIDYAILKDNKPIILIECKAAGSIPNDIHKSQLYRYFSVKEARIGVLTNGIIYRFYSDLESQNRMDQTPYFEADLLSLDDFMIAELKKYSKSVFEIGAILATASDLKYTREIKRILAEQLVQPSDEFVRFFTGRVYTGRATQQIRDTFAERVKTALSQFISERVSDRLKSALAHEEARTSAPSAEGGPVVADQVHPSEDEHRAFYIVLAIVAQVVDPQRLTLRDQKGYSSILLDDSNRKQICRLYFTDQQKCVGLFDAAKAETKVPLTDLVRIYDLAEPLRETALRYVSKPEAKMAAATE